MPRFPGHAASSPASLPATPPSITGRKRKAVPSSPAAPPRKRNLVALGSFRSIAQVAATFSLQYFPVGPAHRLRIEDLLARQCAVPQRLLCLMRILTAHVYHFDRRCEAVCRTLVDLVPTESLIALRTATGAAPADALHSHSHGPDAAQPRNDAPAPATPPPCPSALARAIVVSGAVGLRLHSPALSAEYTGIVDYCIGISAAPHGGTPHLSGPLVAAGAPAAAPYSAFIFLAEAKNEQDIGKAEAQLCAYLAVLRAHRIEAQHASRSPHPALAVHGFATDGLKYTFMSIDDAGAVRRSRQYGLMEESDACEIVGAVVGILERELAQRQEQVRRSRPGSRVPSGTSDIGVGARQQAGGAGGSHVVDVGIEEWVEANVMLDAGLLALVPSPDLVACDGAEGDVVEAVDDFTVGSGLGELDA
ncbi:hypothetical protein DFH27DRAFT_616873 [Peziza echinospora]|nr:hypothetical protein DFH27DRAFT_616873 [Peziza echinospora]